MFTDNINETPARWDVYPEPIRRALNLLKSGVPLATEPGVYTLEDGHMIMQVISQDTHPREELRPESHRKFIDVQFLAAGGPEEIGYYPDLGTSTPDEDLFDTPRDICFWKENEDAQETRIKMQVGTYAIFFPWDMHIPAIQVGAEPQHIKKIVVKVLLDDCTN